MKRKFDHSAPSGGELTGPKYWRSLDELAATPGFKAQLEREFPDGASSLEGVDQAHGAVPMLIARAGQDFPGFNGTVDAFVAEALKHNLPLEVLNHPQGRHGFDIVDDDARSREIVARTFAFLRASFEG